MVFSTTILRLPARLAIAAATICLAALPGHASDALYQTEAIVTGTGEPNRQPGFDKCFADVMVKVSGDQRVLNEPVVAAARSKAGDYVASFRYRDRMEGIPVHDEQGTHDRPHDLYCTFDRARIDALLASAGPQTMAGRTAGARGFPCRHHDDQDIPAGQRRRGRAVRAGFAGVGGTASGAPGVAA